MKPGSDRREITRLNLVFYKLNKTICVGDEQFKTETDRYGKFSVTIDKTDIDEINILSSETDKPIEIIQSYPIFFPDNNNHISVISDIDDTILVSNTRQALKTKGGKDYKENAIRFILENSGNKKFILLGDDTQHDLRIYHAITKSHPHKILKIYIHKTRKNLTGSKKEDMDNFNKLNISTVYFSDAENLTPELEYIKKL